MRPKGRRKLFDVGLYVLRRPAFVSPRPELFEPDDDELVAELEEGEAGSGLVYCSILVYYNIEY